MNADRRSRHCPRHFRRPASYSLFLACTLASVGTFAVHASAALTFSLVPPTTPAPSPSVLVVAPIPDEVRFDLLALNDADAPADYDWPASLACQVTTPDGVVDATAQRIDAAGATHANVAAHAFARQTYAVHLRTVGRIVIELADHSATGTVVTLAPAGASEVPVKPQTASAPTEAPVVTQPRNPIEAVVQRDPNYKTEDGLVEALANRIKPHEPVYILGGGENPELKFQFSFKYQVFDPNGSIAQNVPALGGLYFGYSQTSYWDIDGVSNPFFDTSYRPEGLVSYENLDNYLVDSKGDRLLPDWLRFGFQSGVRHESNGRDGDASRSLNYVYARPIFTIAGQDGWFVSLAPTVFTYIGDLSDNPDIESYRGHGELRAVVGQGGGVQLATTARIGDGLDHGSLQFDLSFPIRKLTYGNLDVYFDAQYFTGYGESLLRYDERVNSLRFGISLVR